MSQSTLSVCVLSVEQDGKRHAVGRVLFPLEGELSHAGRVLWRDLETEDSTQVHAETYRRFACWSLMLMITPSLWFLSVLRAR